MANNWNIPLNLEKEIRERDKVCVYCGINFTSTKISKKTASSWEHIINDAKIITRENIALCCCSCNASKGQKNFQFGLNQNIVKKKILILKLYSSYKKCYQKWRIKIAILLSLYFIIQAILRRTIHIRYLAIPKRFFGFLV